MASILFSHKILAISTNSLVQFFHFSNNNASYDLVSYVDLNSCDLRVPMKQGEKQEQQSQQKHLVNQIHEVKNARISRLFQALSQMMANS